MRRTLNLWPASERPRPLLLLALALSLAPGLAAQTSTSRDLTLVTGRGELLHFDREVHKVAVAEPKIADAMVISPQEVMINAKGPGKTTVVIWETGSVPIRYQISVINDASEHESLRQEIRDSVQNPAIQVTGIGRDAGAHRHGEGRRRVQARRGHRLHQGPSRW